MLGKLHAQAALPPVNNRGKQGSIWRRQKSLNPAGIRTPDRPVRSLVVIPTALLRISCVLTSASRSVSFVNVLLLEKHNGVFQLHTSGLGRREAINCIPWTPYFMTSAAPGNSRVVPIKT